MCGTTGVSLTKSRIVVVGCGNIGSHLVPHVGRMGKTFGIEEVVLVDFDRVEKKNACTQNFDLRDEGRLKAAVLARRLERIAPDLKIIVQPEDVRTMPQGLFSGSVVLGCVDNNSARQYLSEVSWRRKLPYIDAGVHGGQRLVRVSYFEAGTDSACLQCGWEDRDYERLDQSYPCGRGGGGSAAPTNSPSSLGALAAAYQSLVCQGVLFRNPCSETTETAPETAMDSGEQVIIDAGRHGLLNSRSTRNPECRFDHRFWSIEELSRGPESLKLGDALALHPGGDEGIGQKILLFGGGDVPFVTGSACMNCGGSKTFRRPRPRHRLTARQWQCPSCSAAAGDDGATPEMIIPGARMCAGLMPGGDGRLPRDLPLSLLGFRPFDLFTVRSPEGDRRFQLGA